MSAGSDVDPNEFIDGTSVDWVGLAQLGTGSVLITLGVGYASIVTSVFDALVSLFGGYAEFVSTLMVQLLGIPGAVAGAAWNGAASLIGSLGVLATPVGIAIALVVLFMLMRAVFSDG